MINSMYNSQKPFLQKNCLDGQDLCESNLNSHRILRKFEANSACKRFEFCVNSPRIQYPFKSN